MKSNSIKHVTVLLLAGTLNLLAGEPLAKQTPIVFTENKGQIYDQNNNPRPDVLFSGSSNGLVYHLTQKGVSYQLNKIDSWQEVEDKKSKEKISVPERTTIYRIDMNWIGANLNSNVVTGNTLPGTNNYYLSHCSDGILNVKSYDDISFKNVYDGIDLKWYERNGELEYDFIVKPNSDYKQIQIQINGAQNISINKDGELEIKTPLGTIIQRSPIAFQGDIKISSKWKLAGNKLFFELGAYDKNLELIIDPVLRAWGTYYGGAGDDYSRSVATDGSGNVYSGGYSSSTAAGTIIATTGSHQTTHGGGTLDAFLVKFNPSGVRQWSTFYGGTGNDFGLSVSAASFFSDVYLAGYTDSNTGTAIATAGGHQNTYGGGVGDAFLVKFNSSTGARQWGTYYGGSLADYGYACTIDGGSNIILVGSTASTTSTIIATVGSHQPIHGGNAFDGFIVKFDAFGVRQWGTYFGGNGIDHIYGCSVNFATNDFFVTGSNQGSTGTGGIATAGTFQTAIFGGSINALVARFTQNGVRIWGSFFGGTSTDYGYGCVPDASGNVYFTGSASSTGLGSTGSHQATISGTPDAFLAKFSSTGTRVWSTYYGNLQSDIGHAICIDAAGDVIMCGSTESTVSISTAGSHQTVFGGGTVEDAFLAKFNSAGVRQWGSYYGGAGADHGFGICVDNSNVYMAGYTSTSGTQQIATTGSHQSAYGTGATDGFIAKFGDCANLTLTIAGSTVSCSGQSTTLTATGSGFTTYTWMPGASTASSLVVSPVVPTTYTLIAGTATAGCVYSDVHSMTVATPPSVSITASSNTICPGNLISLTGSGASTYSWSTSATTTVISVSPSVTTNYSVIGTSTNGCTDTESITITVISVPTPTITSVFGNTICAGSFTHLQSNVTGSHVWSTGSSATLIAVNPTVTTNYFVSVTNSGCSTFDSHTITVTPGPTINIAATYTSLCTGQTETLTASGAPSYTWVSGPTSAGYIITPAITSTYIVSGYNGTCTATRSINVVVNPLPTITLSISSNTICTSATGGSTIALTGSPSGGTYSGVSTTGSTFNAPSSAGTYTVNYFYSNLTTGCSNITSKTITVSVCTGIEEELTEKGFAIYPNPASSVVNILFTNLNDDTKVELIDVTGKVIRTDVINEVKTEINISGLNSGMYFIKITSKDKEVIKKIIKE